jgi:hypothetical protein
MEPLSVCSSVDWANAWYAFRPSAVHDASLAFFGAAISISSCAYSASISPSPLVPRPGRRSSPAVAAAAPPGPKP